MAAGRKIRPMERGDIEEVVRIIRLHDSDDALFARDMFEKGITFDGDPHHGHMVACEGDTVLGVSGYGADGGEGIGVYWLGWTYVNPWHRGKGIGRSLLESVLDVVRGLGARKLFLETSTLEKYDTAVAFYQQHGFREEGRLMDYYGSGEHKIIMGLPL